ncbi:DUF7210 family protein [Pseudomonas tohonis]|uniref:DUF7210 family protein n=1 Tax=Pseudomonas tohonis TaxID=2725477 RepID=UPI001F26ADBC|nr:hypothetical protein [Pseudomonas tohonis]
MSTDKAPATQKLEDVTLAKPHTHEGVDYVAGATIKVNTADKEWLTQNEIIAGKEPGTK